MKIRRLNQQRVVEAITNGVFAGLMLYLLISRSYLSYVTPRMRPYLWIASVVFLLWSIMGILRIFEPRHRVRSLHCMVLLLPAMLLLLPHQAITSVSAIPNAFSQNQLVQKPEDTSQAVSSDENSSSPISAVRKEPVSSSVQAKQQDKGGYLTQNVYGQTKEIHGYDPVHKKIVVSDAEFYLWTNEIYAHLDKFVGYQITMTGSVYRNPQTIKPGQFLPARLLMTCCTADLEPCGILCDYAKADSLRKDEWVTVTGTIVKGTYQGEIEPHIRVTSVKAAKAVSGYIYPT